MKKILKKSLACMLAAILCLTACVGAMATVGAEGAITYTIDDVAINQGGSDTINVTISNFANVAGLIAEITLPDAVLSIGDVKLNNTAELVKMTDDEPGHYVLNGNTIKFVGLFNSLDEFKLGDVVNTLTINIDVTVVDEAREAAPITAVFAAGDFNEGTLAVNGTDGKLTVNAVCKHEETKEVVVEETAATCTADGSKTISVRCAACDVEISTRTEVIPATGHAYDEGVVTTAPSCTDEGVKTFTCANCGDTYTKAINALGHTAGEAVKENEKAADCVNDGSYDMVVHCTVCNAVMSTETTTVPALGHNFGDNLEYCANECGTANPNYVPPVVGPVVDNTLVFAAKPSVVYGTASIEMAFRVANTVLAKYDDVKIVIIPQKYDTTTLNLVENPAEIVVNKEDLVKAGSTRMQYYFKDLFLYELGLDIDYLLRGYDAEGNLVAVSETFTTSPATWLKDNIAASSDAKFKTMATDTLIVCDEVVKSVAANYPNSDLAKATSVIEGFDTSAATETIGDYNTVNTFESNNADFGTANSDKHQVRTSAQTEKVTFINLRIKDADKVLDWNKLVVNVSYTSKDSAGDHFRSYTYDADDFTWAGRYINVKFDQVGIHDSNKDILFEVVYDGAEICEYTYSVETYLGANLNTTIGAMNTALMKLGQSFRAYQNL